MDKLSTRVQKYLLLGVVLLTASIVFSGCVCSERAVKKRQDFLNGVNK